MLGKATYCILHDLASDLTTLSMNLGMLADDNSVDLELLNYSLNSVDRMSSLLNLARNQFNEKQIWEKIDLEKEISLILSIYRSKFLKESIKIEHRFEGEKYANFPKILLHRVFLNLISNSIDALMSNKKRARRISLKTICDINEFKIIFEDTGCGIPKHIMPKIFKSNFSTKNKSELGFGSGMGLYIVKKTIEKDLKGRLFVDSKYRKYTRFEITIPLER